MLILKGTKHWRVIGIAWSSTHATLQGLGCLLVGNCNLSITSCAPMFTTLPPSIIRLHILHLHLTRVRNIEILRQSSMRPTVAEEDISWVSVAGRSEDTRDSDPFDSSRLPEEKKKSSTAAFLFCYMELKKQGVAAITWTGDPIHCRRRRSGGGWTLLGVTRLS